MCDDLNFFKRKTKHDSIPNRERRIRNPDSIDLGDSEEKGATSGQGLTLL